jgi:hypothetical protein
LSPHFLVAAAMELVIAPLLAFPQEQQFANLGDFK